MLGSLKKNETCWAGTLAALFLLLYLRPYHGIRHDSVLYLGQSLLRWRPEDLSQDLFFAYGSQADFTVLPFLLGHLFDVVAPAQLFLVLTLLARLLFLLASWALLRRLFPSPYGLWGLLALLVLPSNYGGHGALSYGEPFLTGRNLAEPLVLAALAAWWGERRNLAILLLLAAASIHPLQAIPGFLVLWVDLVWQDRRWLHLLWLAVVGFAAALSGLAPFAQWLAPYDSDWYAWTKEANSLCFMLDWRFADWCSLLFDVFLVGAVARYASGRLGSFARAVWLAAVCAFLASLLLVDILHLVLPTGLQLWRAQWLLHWLAMAAAPWLIGYFYRQAGSWKDMRLLLLLSMLVVGVPLDPLPLPPYALLILMPLFLGWDRIAAHVAQKIKILLATGLLVMMIIHFGWFASIVWNLNQLIPDARDVFLPEAVMFAHPLVIGTAILAAWSVWKNWRVLRPFSLVVLLALVVLAVLDWDHRNPRTRAIESAQLDEKVFGVPLIQGGQVFWDGELLAPWLILTRPSYFNYQQNAGLLFNRGTAEEAHRRQISMRALGFQREVCHLINTLQGDQESCVPDVEVFREMCLAANGKLTYLVLPYALKSPALGEWKVARNMRGERPITYRLYRCADL